MMLFEVACKISHFSAWIKTDSIADLSLDLSSIYIANDASICFIMFSKKEEVESIGNPAGIGQGTGFGLRERDRDGIGLGHSRLRASLI